MFTGMVDKRQSVDDLTKMMQQGIHTGVDVVREPDVRVFDSLLTARLNDRHIDSRHRLYHLHTRQHTTSKAKTDTLIKKEFHRWVENNIYVSVIEMKQVI